MLVHTDYIMAIFENEPVLANAPDGDSDTIPNS